MPLLAVDSAAPVTPAQLDAIGARCGQPVRAVFRYLARYAATKTEVAALLASGVSVGLVWNGATASACGTYQQGYSAAQKANAVATALGAPANVTIWLDVEAGWPAAAEFLVGWADGQRAGPYALAGGVYCDQGLHVALTAARAASANASLMPVWLADWTGAPPVVPATWPMGTIGGASVVAWQWAANWQGVDCDLVADGFQGLWEPPAAFPDVAPTDWCYRDVRYVASLGLMDGLPDGTFGPDQTVTRAQLATVAARIARKAGWS